MTDWLNDAVFYEIYPQSFRDSNADGIGDLQGIIEKLDYIRELGCNAVWLNPCFDSPFVDAGYDVRNYYLVAPRYGTNEDLKQLFDAAHARGMHVILDLVPGHTSVECEWFRESSRPERNAYSDRYVWTDSVWNAPDGVGSITGWLRGGYDRDGAAALNFFTAQPALNYGFYEKDADCPWQMGPEDEGPMNTRKAIEDIILFWLGMGCDGFRVDMAGSLVKNDPEKKGTIALWNDVFRVVRKQFPEARFVSEWGEPDKALMAGYDMDFLLHFGPSHYMDLFRTETPFFSREGKGCLKEFFSLYMENRRKTDGRGLICIPSGNHDMDRMAKFLDQEEAKLAFLFLITMPGVPFIYYGDELGMRKLEGLPSHEGGYYRTGSRTPMQWNGSTNAGFSSAPADRLYLPVDTAMMDKINAESEAADPASLYRAVRALLAFRSAHAALRPDADFILKNDGYPLVYERRCEGETLRIIINPSSRAQVCAEAQEGELLFAFGEETAGAGEMPGAAAWIRRI